MSRTRTRYTGSISGTYTFADKTVITHTYPLVSETCVDVIGNYTGDNDFTLAKSSYITGILNGPMGGGQLDNWPMTALRPTKHVVVAPDPASFYTRGMALMNPARASLSLPVALYELREIPRLLKDTWYTFRDATASRTTKGRLRFGSSKYLSVEFGWKPLISDIRNALNVRRAVINRMRMFEALADARGLPQQCHLDSITTMGDWSGEELQHSSLYCLVKVKYLDTTNREVWGSSRWLPSLFFPKSFQYLSERDKEELAFKVACGLHWSQIPLNMWNMLPWSWLIDWFESFSDYLESTNNAIAHSTGRMCVMQRASTRRVYEVISKPPNVSISDHFSVYASKSRRVVSAQTQQGSVPLLTKRKLAILSAILLRRR